MANKSIHEAPLRLSILRAKNHLLTALYVDGERCKQWYIERALEAMEVNLEEQAKKREWEPGVDP